nr:DNA/RNA non-specific endonuclease [Rathayibacter iranicus]
MEFSADSWQASSPGLQKSLAERSEALNALLQGLESLAASGNISGQGADAMRAYIREVHVPIVQSLLVCLSTFQTAIGVYWNGYSQVDTDGNFRLVNDEYDAHLAQLDTGIGQLRGFAADLRSIAARASHLVALDGAGATAADNAAEGFERMRSIAKTQQETWAAYEATDHGFDQVKNLLAELNGIVKNVGSLTVGQGRSYTAGSFDLTLQRLSGLTGGMLDYCRENQQAASDGWETLFSGYVDDVEAEQDRQRKEDALWGVLWDAVQVVEGVLILAVGVVGTPFSAGATLAFAGLGGSLIVGGVNSAINDASIASTGEGLNLAGMASDQVGQWYDVTVMRSAVESGSWAGQLVAGVGSGVGQLVSGAAQMNLRDTGRGIEALVFDEDVRHQAWQQVTTLVDQVRAGNPVVIGQIVGNILPGAAALKIAKTSGLLGEANKFADFGKPIITNPSRTTSALEWLKNDLGAGGVTVSNEFTPTIRPADGIDGATGKPRGIDGPEQKPRGVDGPEERPRGVDGPGSVTPGEKTEVLDPFDPDRKGALLPNVRYRASAPGTNHRYVYETNADGLIERVTVANLFLKTARKRFRNMRLTPGRLRGDDAGHLIADMFDGSPALENLVSQAKSVNRGAGSKWTAMERDWRDALTDVPPRTVTNIEIKVLYDDTNRPTAFEIEYEIDGKPSRANIPNPLPYE